MLFLLLTINCVKFHSTERYFVYDSVLIFERNTIILQRIIPSSYSCRKLKIYVSEETPLENVDDEVPSSGKMLLAQIRSFGTDRLTTLCPELSDQIDKIRHLDESSVAAVPRPECNQCGEICNSIGALSKHSEEAHKQPLQDEDVKKYGQIILNAVAQIEEIKPVS